MLTTEDHIDNEHLKLLAIFHYVFGGFALLGLGFLALHGLIMGMVFTNPKFTEAEGVEAMPKEVLYIMLCFYLFFGALMLFIVVGNVLSANYIRKRKNRLFTQIVAGVNCLQMPFGTILGVMTFIVLSRERVKLQYQGESTIG